MRLGRTPSFVIGVVAMLVALSSDDEGPGSISPLLRAVTPSRHAADERREAG